MSKFYLILFSAILFSSCTSIPIFQKTTDNNEGYKVQDLDSKNNFRVTIQLPSIPSSDKLVRYYGFRAVGEECLARGFHFFDVGELTTHIFEGFCFTSSTRKSLAATFDKKELQKNPIHFIVESLNKKSRSQLKINDEILMVNEKPLVSVGQLKSLIFAEAENKKTSVDLKIRRKNSELNITELLADFKNSTYGQGDLEDLRLKIK